MVYALIESCINKIILLKNLQWHKKILLSYYRINKRLQGFKLSLLYIFWVCSKFSKMNMFYFYNCFFFPFKNLLEASKLSICHLTVQEHRETSFWLSGWAHPTRNSNSDVNFLAKRCLHHLLGFLTVFQATWLTKHE